MRKVRMADTRTYTHEVSKIKSIGIVIFFHLFSPVSSDFFFVLFLSTQNVYIRVFSEYRPSADGRVVVMLHQRLQMRRRVRGRVPRVVGQERRRRRGGGGGGRDGRRAAALR